MIKINISPAVEDEIKKLYEQELFEIDNPAYPGTGKRIPKRIHVSLYRKLEYEISQYVGKKATKQSSHILKQFLTLYFVTNDDVSESRIKDYLFHKDPEQIIQKFWELVSFHWSSKITAITKPPGSYARKLCEMHSICKFYLSEDQRPSYADKDDIPFAKELESFIKVDKVKNSKWKATFVFHDELYGDQTGALKILARIFNYQSNMKDALRHKLMSKMAIPACPYCNRQYITNYRSKSGRRPLADLDHFYCKARYPFLALSIYNFVPSCQICNSRFKKDIDFYIKPHVNPHKRGFGSDAKFVLTDPKLLLDDHAWNHHDELVVQLDVDGPDADMIRQSIQTFQLNEVYESHTDYIREIIWKSKAYSPEMIKCVWDEFGDLFHSEDEIKELVFGQYLSETDASKRPLAKLTQDLLGKADEWNWPASSPRSSDDS